MIKAGQYLLPHLLTDCAIRGFFQNELKFEDVY